MPRSTEGLQGHTCIVRDRGTEERLFLTVLQHDFHSLSLLLLTISSALLAVSHLAEALMAFQALELAVHMSPLYVSVHTYGCRYTFWLFRFVCVTRLTQPLQGFQVSPSTYAHLRAQCLGPVPWPSCSHRYCSSCLHFWHIFI